MTMDAAAMTRIDLATLITAVADTIAAHADELTALDQAIGDGDHGLNMKRGFEAVRAEAAALAEKPLPEALKAIGTKLVMTVGGASGPLFGTLFMSARQGTAGRAEPRRLAAALAKSIDAVAARGKSQSGQKTMLDVLYPGAGRARGGQDRAREVADTADAGGRSDQAHEGDTRPRVVPRRPFDRPYGPRCAFLGADRARHRRNAGASRMKNVGIVIVSHSPKVAEGTADMVRQMVGEEVPLAWCGGNPDGGLGTQVGAIMEAIDRAWSEAGVAILVDLGGAETNSEMAVEMIGEPRASRIVICNAPIVEGAVMAATEASGGASLKEVVATAHELAPA